MVGLGSVPLPRREQLGSHFTHLIPTVKLPSCKWRFMDPTPALSISKLLTTVQDQLRQMTDIGGAIEVGLSDPFAAVEPKVIAAFCQDLRSALLKCQELYTRLTELRRDYLAQGQALGQKLVSKMVQLENQLLKIVRPKAEDADQARNTYLDAIEAIYESLTETQQNALVNLLAENRLGDQALLANDAEAVIQLLADNFSQIYELMQANALTNPVVAGLLNDGTVDKLLIVREKACKAGIEQKLAGNATQLKNQLGLIQEQGARSEFVRAACLDKIEPIYQKLSEPQQQALINLLAENGLGQKLLLENDPEAVLLLLVDNFTQVYELLEAGAADDPVIAGLLRNGFIHNLLVAREQAGLTNNNIFLAIDGPSEEESIDEIWDQSLANYLATNKIAQDAYGIDKAWQRLTLSEKQSLVAALEDEEILFTFENLLVEMPESLVESATGNLLALITTLYGVRIDLRIGRGTEISNAEIFDCDYTGKGAESSGVYEVLLPADNRDNLPDAQGAAA